MKDSKGRTFFPGDASPGDLVTSISAGLGPAGGFNRYKTIEQIGRSFLLQEQNFFGEDHYPDLHIVAEIGNDKTWGNQISLGKMIPRDVTKKIIDNFLS